LTADRRRRLAFSHAWLNPLRVRATATLMLLLRDDPVCSASADALSA
jgi:hypothetical protein